MEELTEKELIELYKLFEQRILSKKSKFKEQRFKDDELIQQLLKVILLQEQKMKVGILKYIDLENIDFTNQDLLFIDLSETNINTNLDPQKIKNKSLQGVKLKGDFKDKSFNGVCVCGVDFSKAKNVTINPQELAKKNITDAICDGVDFCNESFDGVNYNGSNFTNAKNCELTKNKYNQLKTKILKI